MKLFLTILGAVLLLIWYIAAESYYSRDHKQFRAKRLIVDSTGLSPSIITRVVTAHKGNRQGDTVILDDKEDAYILLEPLHSCPDSTHHQCDGNCTCDGMECDR